MTLSTGYVLIEKGAELTLRWMSPTLPFFFAVVASAGVLLLPLAFFFRTPLAAWTARHLHWRLSPRALAFLAPGLSIVCAVGLFFTRPARPVIEWRFNDEGFEIQSLNGAARMKWSEVASARFDDRAPNLQKASLVLKAADNREAWLILEWLLPAHREKVLSRIRKSLPKSGGFLPKDEKTKPA
jgi:hypothetical protein